MTLNHIPANSIGIEKAAFLKEKSTKKSLVMDCKWKLAPQSQSTKWFLFWLFWFYTRIVLIREKFAFIYGCHSNVCTIFLYKYKLTKLWHSLWVVLWLMLELITFDAGWRSVFFCTRRSQFSLDRHRFCLRYIRDTIMEYSPIIWFAQSVGQVKNMTPWWKYNEIYL